MSQNQRIRVTFTAPQRETIGPLINDAKNCLVGYLSSSFLIYYGNRDHAMVQSHPKGKLICLSAFPELHDFKKYISIFQSCRNCTKYSQTIVFLLIGGLCTIKSYFPLGKKCCFRDWKVFWDTFSADGWKKSIINSCDIFVPLPTTIEPLDLTIWVEKKEGLLVSFFVKIHPIFNASQQTKSLTRAFEFYYQNILDFRPLLHNVICLLFSEESILFNFR